MSDNPRALNPAVTMEQFHRLRALGYPVSGWLSWPDTVTALMWLEQEEYIEWSCDWDDGSYGRWALREPVSIHGKRTPVALLDAVLAVLP